MRKIIFLMTCLFSSIISAQDGSLDMSFDAGLSATDVVDRVLLQPDGKILVSGNMQINSVAKKVIRLNPNGSLDAGFNVPNVTDSHPYLAALQPDGKILLVGNSTQVGNKYGLIFRLNADGSLDGTFKTLTGANDPINVLLLQPDGKIIIGGGMTIYNGTAINHIARLNTDGTIDNSFSFGLTVDNVYYMRFLPTGKTLVQFGHLTGGLFMTYEITRLNSDWTQDNTFATVNNCFFSYTLWPQSTGKIIIFETCVDWDFSPPPHEMLIRLNSDGTVDNTFYRGGVGGGLIYQFALQGNDQIIITGDFTTYDSFTENHIARLNVNGTLDADFSGGTGPNDLVTNIEQQADGKIVIAGDFTSYNGVVRNHIARLLNVTLAASEFDNKAFTFYPNPVKDMLYLNFPDEMMVNGYEIYDLLAQKVIISSLMDRKQINVSNLSHGVYMLKVKTENGTFNRKFIKE
ncbi:T9SS type A sorting domain-containing protein [Flavobacterium pedocola]